MRWSSPPALACWIFESVLPVFSRESMLGDLVEEYEIRAESGSSLVASRWFWSQTFRSIPFLIWSVLRNGWLMSVGVATSVYVFMAVLKFGMGLLLSKWVVPEPSTQVVLGPFIFLAIAGIGGCVAAKIQRSATIILALMVMITVVILISIHVCPVPVPWWYRLGFLTLGPFSVLVAPATIGIAKPTAGRPAT